MVYASGSERLGDVRGRAAPGTPSAVPDLLVVDDAEARRGVVERLRELAGELEGKPVLALATAAGGMADGIAESLALSPLDRRAVHHIAEFYAPDAAAPSRSASSSAAAAASPAGFMRWPATGPAGGDAPRGSVCAARRGRARRAARVEHQLAGSVVDLQAARERARPAATASVPVVCPFKGLASFEVADAPYFFGRERLVAELVARLRRRAAARRRRPVRQRQVVGRARRPAGALAGGVLPGSDDWPQIVIRPGRAPVARAAGDADARRATVLAVDQFEEIFTACRDEGERAAFIDALVRDGARPATAVVVLALRADFYGRCAALPRALAACSAPTTCSSGRCAATSCAGRSSCPPSAPGCASSPSSSTRWSPTSSDEPGGLPLLSDRAARALAAPRRPRPAPRRLRAHGRRPRRRRAAGRGRLRPARSRRSRRLARAVLLRLAGEGEGGASCAGASRSPSSTARTTTRRGARRPDRASPASRSSAGEVEVAHEALLREWPRLRGWLDEDAQGRRIHRHLADAARDWDDRGRDAADLYRGARLAVGARVGAPPTTTSSTRSSGRSSTPAGRRQPAPHRRLRLALGGVAALLVLGAERGPRRRSSARRRAPPSADRRRGTDRSAGAD